MSNPKHVPYVIKANGAITMYLNGESMTVEIDHPNYSKIVDALKAEEFGKLDHLVNIGRAVTSYAKGTVRIENGQIFFGTFALHNTLTNRILKMMNEGFKFEHMLRFLENLMQNPSNRAVNETYTFLENYGLPITDDGCFLAYKAVNGNYKDIYSGKIDNSIGATPSMPRNQVDERYEVDCSHGLHVGALKYVVQYGHFTQGQPVTPGGNRLLIVKVNPRDVVSVPQYESHPKMRVATYTVVDEIKDVVKELDKVVYTAAAKELAPDRGSEDDAALPTDSDDYDTGFDDGTTDNEKGNEYGESRDYDLTGGYLKGYNDGFHGRDFNPPELADSESDDDESDDEFQAGRSLGEDDYSSALDYGASLEDNASEIFKDGYRAGYNGEG